MIIFFSINGEENNLISLPQVKMIPMWISVFLVLCVSITSAEYGWRAGTQYCYSVRGRTVTGLHQVANQFSGVLMRAKLNIQAKSDSTLSLQIKGAEYAEVHANFSNGWDTEIMDELLNYKKLPLHDDPFELYLDDGIIKEMTINKGIQTWEINILKAIVSLLQIDTRAENIKKSKLNLVPRSEMGMGVYKTMEDSVNGIYETIYDISQLQEYILQSKPELLPLPNLRSNGKVFEIIKTRNFSNSNQHMVYHFGLDGQTNWEAGSNQMGNFLTRTSVSKVIISGNLKRYTIQSSVTNEKIIIAPHLYNKQKGMVGSSLNLTIESINSIKQPFTVVSNPQPIRNLVYENNPVGIRRKDSRENIKGGFSDYGSDASIEIQSSKMIRHHKISSEDTSSSSSSSESESMNSHESYYLPNSGISEPIHPNIIPLYINEKIDKFHAKEMNSIQNVIMLTRDIGQGIISPNTLTGERILNKFTILLRILRTMSAHDFKEVSDKLYYPFLKAKRTNSLESTLNYQTWVSFRDAVAQAGSGPALMAIRDWISTKKIEAEEASYLITSLSSSAKYPTIEYLKYFFDMLSDETVSKQTPLRVSAVLSFTDLVRKAAVDRRTSHNYYPVHIFGPLTKKGDRVVLEKFIPYFQKQLQTAVEDNDSINIQLNIRALNNIAHPRILTVFEPYLEGKIMITKFQRLTIVASMDKIVKLYPELVRTVLYRIYQNMADTPEIRTASIMQLMKTNPPVLMLQQMAQQTNFDLDKQVNAAVKSAIESIATQKENEYNRNIVEKARAAVNMLNPENYGVQYSRNFINSYIVKEQNLAYKHHLSHIQSSDSIFPSSLFYHLKQNIGGYKYDMNEVQLMTSSMKKLCNQLYGEFFGRSNKHSREYKNNRSDSKWSLNNIYDSLDFEKEEEEQLEGNLLFTMLGGKQYFAFDNYTVANIPNIIAGVGTNLMTNNRLNYTKIYNKYSMEIAFPMSMGLPFIFTLETPTLINMGLQMRGSMYPLQFRSVLSNMDILSITGNYHFTYSSYKESKMGFITPYNGKMYSAVLEKNVHTYIPVKTRVDLNLKETKADVIFELLENNNVQKLIEYSSSVYTNKQNVYNINPIGTGEHFQIIYNTPMRTVKYSLGKEKTGFSFDLKLETDRKNLDLNYLYENLKEHDLFSLASYADMLDEINNQNYTITYNPRNSWAKSLKISLAYDKISNITKKSTSERTNFSKHRSREQENFAIPSSENKEFYQKELIENVATGIEDAQAHLITLQMAFEGNYKTEYEVNFAYADSHVSDVSRILAFVRNSTTLPLVPNSYSAALQVTSTMPHVSLENYKEMLKKIPISKIRGRVDFGEKTPYNSYITVMGELTSSHERREYLRQHPLAILCEKQTQEGYKIQPACRNITRRINYLDNYHFNINYQNIPNEFKNIANMIYKYIYHIWYDFSIENREPKKLEGNIDVDVKFGKSLLVSNVSVVTSEFADRFEYIPIHEWIRPLVVVHPQHNMIERLGQKLLIAQQSSMCVFDKDRITTFDNTSYYINIGNNAYILTQNIPENYIPQTNKNNDEYFSIILHQLPSELLELTIVVEDDVLEMTPTQSEGSVKIIYNGQQIEVSGSVTLLEDSHGHVLKLFVPSQGVVKLVVEKHGFEIMYHGNHASIEVSNKFRGNLRGLCGNFDGESYNDFITPQNCIKSRKQFIESYNLGNLTSSILGSKEKTFNNQCYKQTYLFGNIVNEKEVKQYEMQKRMNYEDKLKKRFLKEMVEASHAFIS